MPRHALRGLGIDPERYVWVRTGSHRNSLRALQRGEIEAAPIDSTLLTLELRADPELGRSRASRASGRCRARRSRSSAATRALRARCARRSRALGESAAGRAALALGALERFDAMADDDYAPVRAADATR